MPAKSRRRTGKPRGGWTWRGNRGSLEAWVDCAGSLVADRTAIEWTDATFNPWWGCSRVSPACAHCYADTLARRYGHDLWKDDSPRRFLSEQHWTRPRRWNRHAERRGRRIKVFCASMADVFENHPELET